MSNAAKEFVWLPWTNDRPILSVNGLTPKQVKRIKKLSRDKHGWPDCPCHTCRWKRRRDEYWAFDWMIGNELDGWIEVVRLMSEEGTDNCKMCGDRFSDEFISTAEWHDGTQVPLCIYCRERIRYEEDVTTILASVPYTDEVSIAKAMSRTKGDVLGAISLLRARSKE